MTYLEQFVSETGISRRTLADGVGIDPTHMGRVVSGVVALTPQLAERLLHTFPTLSAGGVYWDVLREVPEERRAAACDAIEALHLRRQ